jgi:hypothetical protein
MRNVKDSFSASTAPRAKNPESGCSIFYLGGTKVDAIRAGLIPVMRCPPVMG